MGTRRRSWLTVEGNKAAIRTFYDRSDAGDLAVHDDMLTPDFVNHGGPAGEIHGPTAFKEADSKLRWTGIAIYRLDGEGRIGEGRIAKRWQEIDGLGLFGQLPPMGG